MNTDRLTQVSATTAARRIRQGEVSSQDTVRRYLERIEQINPLLNTVIQLAPDSAIQQARAADEAVRRGDPVGPLNGVPFTVMDVFPIAGSARLVAASNMRDALYFGESREATVVSRLRMAGAIPIGVTKATEWSDRDGHYGRSHNPYDLDRTPGGSSGGEAATVAAGASAFGIGSDAGGTLRIPAHYCGVAALRPSNGRVPRGIDSDNANDFQTVAGPVARSVDDLITIMEIISGVDHGDSRSVPLTWRDPKSVNLRGLRVALFTNNGIAPPTPAVAKAVIAAAASLERAGAYVDNITPPSLDTALQLARRYRHYGAAEGNVAEYYKFLERLDSYRLIMTEFISDFDLILCPVEAFAAPASGASRECEPFTYTAPFSLLGWPCATVRAGTSAEGLPIGVQVVGSPWRDDLALAAALHIENVLGGWRPPNLGRNAAGETLAAA